MLNALLTMALNNIHIQMLFLLYAPCRAPEDQIGKCQPENICTPRKRRFENKPADNLQKCNYKNQKRTDAHYRSGKPVYKLITHLNFPPVRLFQLHTLLPQPSHPL